MKAIKLKEARILTNDEMKSVFGGSRGLWRCNVGANCSAQRDGKYVEGTCVESSNAHGPICYCEFRNNSGEAFPLGHENPPCWSKVDESGSGGA